jgi:4-hydroxy-tetrahydrodipicolinate reductase
MDADNLNITVVGAAGRMGRAVLLAAAAEPDLDIAAAVVRAGHPLAGQDAGEFLGLGLGLTATSDLELAIRDADVVIEFTRADHCVAVARACAAAGRPLVSGTTGLDAAARAALAEVARKVAVVHAPNMSVGVTVLAALVEQASRALGPGFDAEIVELHHRHKVDAPSGTALRLGEAVAHGRGERLGAQAIHAREGQTGARPAGGIGYAVLRGGEVVGEHTVHFLGDGERLELTHRASDRANFAQGALRAARWIRGRAPGLYGMREVLGLS